MDAIQVNFFFGEGWIYDDQYDDNNNSILGTRRNLMQLLTIWVLIKKLRVTKQLKRPLKLRLYTQRLLQWLDYITIVLIFKYFYELNL